MAVMRFFRYIRETFKPYYTNSYMDGRMIILQSIIFNSPSAHFSYGVFKILLCYMFYTLDLVGPDKGSESFPEYPGFEKDVFIMIRDYFESVSEPLTTHLLYPVLISIYSKYLRVYIILTLVLFYYLKLPETFSQSFNKHVSV